MCATNLLKRCLIEDDRSASNWNGEEVLKRQCRRVVSLSGDRVWKNSPLTLYRITRHSHKNLRQGWVPINRYWNYLHRHVNFYILWYNSSIHRGCFIWWGISIVVFHVSMGHGESYIPSTSPFSLISPELDNVNFFFIESVWHVFSTQVHLDNETFPTHV